MLGGAIAVRVKLIAWSLLQGALTFALVAAIFVMALRLGMPEQEVRALTFSLVVAIVSLILVYRSFSASLLTALRRPNRTLVAVLAAVAVSWPSACFGRSQASFSPLDPCTPTIWP